MDIFDGIKPSRARKSSQGQSQAENVQFRPKDRKPKDYDKRKPKNNREMQKVYMEMVTMSNYILHLPEHTWNDLLRVEHEFPVRKCHSAKTSPAKRKIIRTSKLSKSTKAQTANSRL